MEYLKQVHDFATKWTDKFRDQKINYIELVDHYMADDCEALGFQMDCGHAFLEKYGNAASKFDELNRVIDAAPPEQSPGRSPKCACPPRFSGSRGAHSNPHISRP